MDDRDALIAMMTPCERRLYAAMGGALPRRRSRKDPEWYVPKKTIDAPRKPQPRKPKREAAAVLAAPPRAA